MKKIIKTNKKTIQTIIRNIIGKENEDIEQEVYIKVWRNSNKKNITKINQWINKITANTCKDFLRSKQYKTENLKINDDEIINQIKETKTPEKILNAKQRQKTILNAINKLPKKMKEAIILYEFEQKSYDEISQKLNIPKGTVKSRIFCAREILKEELSELLGD